MGAVRRMCGLSMRRAGAAVVAALALSNVALGLDVERTDWGFDGNVQLKRFNLLSILVRNNTPNPYEGQLTLTRRTGTGGPVVDAPVVEPMFVSPFGTRWVQVPLYCSQEYEAWTLTWGRSSRDRLELSAPKVGPPARVFLVPGDDPTIRTNGIRRFSDSLFPPNVTSTDGLGSLVVGHVPRWEPARRKAFLDWIVRGGTVHLMTDSQGGTLSFPADLADLNAPLEEFRVGSGRVFRYAGDRSRWKPTEIEARENHTKALKEAVRDDGPAVADVPGEETSTGEEITGAAPSTTPLEDDATPAVSSANSTTAVDPDENQWYAGDSWLNDLAQGLFGQLKKMTKADHHWLLIYLMALVYIGLIFPGFFVLGRRRIDYRVTYGAFLGVVVLFSAGFAFVGRRGYGESTTVHTVAVAQALGHDAWDVSLFSNAFVRDGADYRIAHAGSGVAFSTCQDVEAVNGVIRNGPEGSFVVDIPPFSSRSYGARVKIDGIPVQFTLREFRAVESSPPAGSTPGTVPGPPSEGRPPQLLSLDIEAKGLKGQPMFAVLAFGNQMHDLTLSGARMRLQNSTGQPCRSWFKALEDNNSGMGMYGWDDSSQTMESRYQKLYQPLVARGLGISSRKDMKKLSLPPDRLRLLVFAAMPDEFEVQNADLGRQEGRTLFVVDLFPSDLSTTSP